MKVVLVLLFSTVCSAVQDENSKKVFSDSSDGSEAKSCECVPYYRCRSFAFVSDSDTPDSYIDIRPQSACDNYYLSVCCSIQDIIHDDIVDTQSPQNRKGCGVRNPDGVGFRIPSGKSNEAEFGEFPWIAAVLHEKEVNSTKEFVYHCGGALIHPLVVTTAAHCLRDRDVKLKVRLGEWDIQTRSELYPHQDRDVKAVIIHSKFNVKTLANDIALLFLENPVEIVENVDVVCLPKQDMVVDESKCFATGWGKNSKGGNFQGILKKVELPLVPNNSCQENLRKTRLGINFELHSSFICAGGMVNEDICQGDDGGPLVCPVPGLPGRYLQAGIVSWGVGCGDDQIPGAYTNVAKYSDWIDEQLTQNNFSVSYYKY